MIVLALEVDLHLTNHARSLKEKRSVIRSLKQKLHDKFGVAVAEVSSQDLWQRCGLGIAYVSETKRQAQQVLDSALHFIENFRDLEILNCDWQIV